MTKCNETLRMMEFFSGIGGMRCAVEQVLSTRRTPLQCRAFDIFNEANSVYRHNFHDESSSRGVDFPTGVSTKLVEQLRPEDIPACDLWTMSPPCQPFTTTRFAKQKDLEDKRTAGFQALCKLLCALPVEKRPRWIFLENVPGFLQSRARTFLHEHLRLAGYPTWSEFVLSPAHLGIPNQRTRYYIMTEWNSQRFVDHASTCCNDLSPYIVKEGSDLNKKRKRDMGDNLKRNLSSFVDKSLNQTSPRWSELVLSDDILSKDWARELPIVRLPKDDVETEDSETYSRMTYCFTAGYGRQLHKSTGSILFVPDERSLEQNDSFKVDDVSSKSMVDVYSNQLRRFSPEELLGLFGFPPEFAFPANIGLEHRYRLVGNSISIFVVSALIQELIGSEEAGDLC